MDLKVQRREAEMKVRKRKQEQKAEWEGRKPSLWRVAGEEGSGKSKQRQGRSLAFLASEVEPENYQDLSLQVPTLAEDEETNCSIPYPGLAQVLSRTPSQIRLLSNTFHSSDLGRL